MAMTSEFGRAKQFFRSYFHQDWLCEAAVFKMLWRYSRQKIRWKLRKMLLLILQQFWHDRGLMSAQLMNFSKLRDARLATRIMDFRPENGL